jgi:hypothetical protein
MSEIHRVEVHIVTGDRKNAGTAEQVILGLGGQEFTLDSMANDFQRGSDRTYVLGEGANVSDARHNDPRSLSLAEVAAQPVYLRVGPAPQQDEAEPTRGGKGALADILNRAQDAAQDAGTAVRGGIMGTADTLRNYFASGDWNLEEATVTVRPADGAPMVFTALRGEDNAWLGGRGQPKQLVLSAVPST